MAVDRKTGYRVAVKRQREDCPAAAREYLVYRKLRATPHANLLGLLDAFRAPAPDVPGRVGVNHFYTVHNFLDTNLLALAQFRRGYFERAEAAELFKFTAAGVAHMHRADLVHGDLSFENVLVNGVYPHWEVRVADFGGAFDAGRLLAPVWPDVPTTIGFVAPEVAVGSALTAAADAWALGCHAALVTTETIDLWKAGPDATNEDMLAAHARVLGGPGPSFGWVSLSAALVYPPVPANVAAAPPLLLFGPHVARPLLQADAHTAELVQALLAWDPALRQGMAAAAVTSLWKLVELARPPAQAAESPPAPGGEVEAKEGEAEEVAKGQSDDQAGPGRTGKPFFPECV